MNVRSLSSSVHRRWLTALVAVICLAPIVLPMQSVDAAPGYKPRPKKAAQRTTTTATRSDDYRLGSAECTANWPAPWGIVMPQMTEEQDVQTTLTRPPLFFHVQRPGKAIGRTNIAVRLYEVTNREQPILQETYRTNKSGLFQMTYPASAPDLIPGKTYEWEVQILCANDTQNVGTRVAMGRFTTTPATADLVNQIAQATSAEQKAEIYASAGLWTEAFLTAQSSDRLSLLAQIQLKNTLFEAIQLKPNPLILPAINANHLRTSRIK